MIATAASPPKRPLNCDSHSRSPYDRRPLTNTILNSSERRSVLRLPALNYTGRMHKRSPQDVRHASYPEFHGLPVLWPLEVSSITVPERTYSKREVDADGLRLFLCPSRTYGTS